jgi:hypothetical protein
MKMNIICVVYWVFFFETGSNSCFKLMILHEIWLLYLGIKVCTATPGAYLYFDLKIVSLPNQIIIQKQILSAIKRPESWEIASKCLIL